MQLPFEGVIFTGYAYGVDLCKHVSVNRKRGGSVFSIVQYAIAYTISNAVQFNSVYRLTIIKQYSTTLTVYYNILVPL